MLYPYVVLKIIVNFKTNRAIARAMARAIARAIAQRKSMELLTVVNIQN